MYSPNLELNYFKQNVGTFSTILHDQDINELATWAVQSQYICILVQLCNALGTFCVYI